jgi:hypothetical protein
MIHFLTLNLILLKHHNVFIDGLVNGGVLVFTMLRTYTSSKSGLSARKSVSNSGDVTISLRMVNEDTS